GAREGPDVQIDVAPRHTIAASGPFTDRSTEKGEVVPAAEQFGQPGKLKKEDVPGPQQLREFTDLTFVGSGMRRVEDDELADTGGPGHGEMPGNTAAPVMAGDSGPFGAGVANQFGDVLAEEREAIRGDTRRLVGEVVAAQIGDEDTEAGRGQGGDLEAP